MLQGCHSALLSARTPHNRRLVLAVFAAVLGNFTFGYALVYTSPVIPALEISADPALRLNTLQASWFGVRAMVLAGQTLRPLKGTCPPTMCLGCRSQLIINS